MRRMMKQREKVKSALLLTLFRVVLPFLWKCHLPRRQNKLRNSDKILEFFRLRVWGLLKRYKITVSPFLIFICGGNLTAAGQRLKAFRNFTTKKCGMVRTLHITRSRFEEIGYSAQQNGNVLENYLGLILILTVEEKNN